MQVAAATQGPEFSSLAEEQNYAAVANGKEAAELRAKLDTVSKENASLMRQFQEQSETIRVLSRANEHHQEKITELTTDKTLQEEVNTKQYDEMEKLNSKVMVAEQKAHNCEQEVDDMAKAIQRHDFKGCSCQVYLLPAVDRALNKDKKFKMGVRAEGVVDNLRAKVKTAEQKQAWLQGQAD